MHDKQLEMSLPFDGADPDDAPAGFYALPVSMAPSQFVCENCDARFLCVKPEWSKKYDCMHRKNGPHVFYKRKK